MCVCVIYYVHKLSLFSHTHTHSLSLSLSLSLHKHTHTWRFALELVGRAGERTTAATADTRKKKPAHICTHTQMCIHTDSVKVSNSWVHGPDFTNLHYILIDSLHCILYILYCIVVYYIRRGLKSRKSASLIDVPTRALTSQNFFFLPQEGMAVTSVDLHSLPPRTTAQILKSTPHRNFIWYLCKWH